MTTLKLGRANATASLHDMSTSVHVDNCVATFNLLSETSTPIDLVAISRVLPFVEYNSHRFAAASMRLRNPKTTCLVFSSSNCVVTGANSQQAALKAAWVYVSVLRRYSQDFTVNNWKVQNLVSSGCIQGLPNLESMHTDMGETTAYEHELFPGLVIREPDLQPVVLCFRSGKFVITGSRTHTDIVRATDRLMERVRPYLASMNNETSNSAVYHHLCRSNQILQQNCQDFA